MLRAVLVVAVCRLLRKVERGRVRFSMVRNLLIDIIKTSANVLPSLDYCSSCLDELELNFLDASS